MEKQNEERIHEGVGIASRIFNKTALNEML